MDKNMRFCQKLEQEIEEYSNMPTKNHRRKLIPRIRSIFRCKYSSHGAIHKTTREQGWDIVRAASEAQVEIGKTGGTVLSEDSDMLFYPSIDIVIKLLAFNRKREYQIYYKSPILSTFQLSSAAFTALGILLANGYDVNFHGEYQTQSHLISTQELIETHITKMNAETGKLIALEDYTKSFRVFILQEENVLLSSYYDIRSRGLKTAAHYLKKLKG